MSTPLRVCCGDGGGVGGASAGVIVALGVLAPSGHHCGTTSGLVQEREAEGYDVSLMKIRPSVCQFVRAHHQSFPCRAYLPHKRSRCQASCFAAKGQILTFPGYHSLGTSECGVL